MESLKTTVFRTRAAQFDMTGRLLGHSLQLTDETISAGLATRLHRHAVKRLAEAGLAAAVAHCVVDIYTMDADEKPADRSYCVQFTNAQNTSIEVIGILTSKGWPTLDHGFAISEG